MYYRSVNCLVGIVKYKGTSNNPRHSSAILLISAFLFYLLSKIPQEQKKGNVRFWFGLGVVFTFLAFDESAKIHETLGDLTEKFVDHSGYLYYPWVFLFSFFLENGKKALLVIYGSGSNFSQRCCGVLALRGKRSQSAWCRYHNILCLLYDRRES